MYTIIFSEKFERSLSKIKDKKVRKQIWKKTLELEKRAMKNLQKIKDHKTPD